MRGVSAYCERLGLGVREFPCRAFLAVVGQSRWKWPVFPHLKHVELLGLAGIGLVGLKLAFPSVFLRLSLALLLSGDGDVDLIGWSVTLDLGV